MQSFKIMNAFFFKSQAACENNATPHLSDLVTTALSTNQKDGDGLMGSVCGMMNDQDMGFQKSQPLKVRPRLALPFLFIFLNFQFRIFRN
jgi:hypothetical protein